MKIHCSKLRSRILVVLSDPAFEFPKKTRLALAQTLFIVTRMHECWCSPTVMEVRKKRTRTFEQIYFSVAALQRSLLDAPKNLGSFLVGVDEDRKLHCDLQKTFETTKELLQSMDAIYQLAMTYPGTISPNTELVVYSKRRERGYKRAMTFEAQFYKGAKKQISFQLSTAIGLLVAEKVGKPYLVLETLLQKILPARQKSSFGSISSLALMKRVQKVWIDGDEFARAVDSVPRYAKAFGWD